MVAEALTIFACLNQTGCAETASQYRLYNPAPFKQTDELIERYDRAFFINYWGPALAVSLGREGSIKLHRNLSLILVHDRTTLLFKAEF